MPTSIFFNGKMISVPGSYSQVDASGLEQVGLGATGIIAVIGTAEGGIPVSALTSTDDFLFATTPEKARALFRSGDLKEVGDMLFAPSSDPNIPGGAIRVYFFKANPATQSTATFSNGSGDCLVLTSKDYGGFTGQINASIGAGTVKAGSKLVTLLLEDTTEANDNLGGDTIFNIKYAPPVPATISHIGMDGDITLPGGDAKITVVSSAGGDTTQTVTVYGTNDSSGLYQTETITLTGTAPVTSSLTYKATGPFGGVVAGTTTGSVTVKTVFSGLATIMTIAAGTNNSKGLITNQALYSTGTVSLVSSGISTKKVLVVGLDLAGAGQGEVVALTGTTAVASADSWSEVRLLVLGNVEAAQTVTLTPVAASTPGWQAMTAQVKAGGLITCLGSRAHRGMATGITPPGGNAAVTVVSDSAADTTQVVTIYGLTIAGVPQTENLTLAGLTPVAGTKIWLGSTGIFGAGVSAAAAGTITIKTAYAGTATIMTLTPAVTTKGLIAGQTMYAASKISFVSDSTDTKALILSGLGVTGAAQSEVVTLTNTTPVLSANIYTEVRVIVLGVVEAARTITITATAVQTAAAHNTMQKVADYFNARYLDSLGGFVLALVTPSLTMSPTNLDIQTSAVSVLSPANPAFLADLYAIINALNASSQLVTAAAASGAKDGAPSNTVTSVFLSGGSEGTASITDYQNALNWMKHIYVNTIVPLTGDPAVHQIVMSHCAYMCGIGRSERDAVCGAMNTALTNVPTKTEYKADVVNLNSRHTRLTGQAITRYDTNGTLTEFMPPFHAAIIAGMQAGAEVALPLTHKYANVISIRSDSTWNPVDDSEEMIQAGCLFMENVEGIGRRVVRNVTTYLSTNNLAYSEASVNQAVNFSCYNFRTNMEYAVGQKGFSGTINAAKGLAIGTLTALVDNAILVTYRSLAIEVIADVMEISIEIAPILPINFVKSIIHLVTLRQSA